MQDRKIGVDPHPKPWPKDSKYDKELLQNGDTRNVLDKYRYWNNDAIKKDLDESRFNLHIAIENWQHDFNAGTIIRNANAFNVNTVHIIGKRHYNRRGAMVTDKYMNIEYHPTVEEFVAKMKQSRRKIIAVDILPQSLKLSNNQLPKNCVLVFGGEGPGLSEAIQKLADEIIRIEQFGSTRSINVGVASGILMYEWVRQNVLKQ